MAGHILSPLARADMVGIWSYSAGRWDDDQADRYIRQIESVFARIGLRPSQGRPCNDIRPGYFRISSGSHVVFYHKAGATVRVVRVLHQSMDFQRHL